MRRWRHSCMHACISLWMVFCWFSTQQQPPLDHISDKHSNQRTESSCRDAQVALEAPQRYIYIHTRCWEGACAALPDIPTSILTLHAHQAPAWSKVSTTALLEPPTNMLWSGIGHLNPCRLPARRCHSFARTVFVCHPLSAVCATENDTGVTTSSPNAEVRLVMVHRSDDMCLASSQVYSLLSCGCVWHCTAGSAQSCWSQQCCSDCAG